MNDLERLYTAQAIMKTVADFVSTKNPESLRSYMDGKMQEDYETSGIKSRDAIINGQKVGTYSVKVRKGTKDKVEKVARVFDTDQVIAWAKDNPDELVEWFGENAQSFVDYCFETYGEVPDGARVEEEVTPGKPAGYNGTTLRIDPPKVAEALHGQLDGVVSGLLTGGAGE